jgi:hypothetical protein
MPYDGEIGYVFETRLDRHRGPSHCGICNIHVSETYRYMIPGTGFELRPRRRLCNLAFTSAPPKSLSGGFLKVWLRTKFGKRHVDRLTPLATSSSIIYCLPRDKLATLQEMWSIRESLHTDLQIYVGSRRGGGYWTGQLLNHRTRNLLVRWDSSSLLAVAGLSFTIYGCLHLLAWFYSFSSTRERRLWRAATIITISLVPAVIVPFAINFVFDLLDDKIMKVRRSNHGGPSCVVGADRLAGEKEAPLNDHSRTRLRDTAVQFLRSTAQHSERLDAQGSSNSAPHVYIS